MGQAETLARSPAKGDIARSEIAAFYDDYVVGLDEGRIEQWPEFFTDDAFYRVTAWENFERSLPHSLIYCDGRSMIVDRALAIRQTTVHEVRRLRYFVSGLSVAMESGMARVRSNFLVIEALSDRDPQVFLVGRSHDEVVRTPDGLRFRKRVCVYDNYRILTSLIMPV